MSALKNFFALVGAVATTMFILGYAYASVPLVVPKTCTPTFIDRILK
jgi:cytochrome c oxidase assembly protein Cox11